MSHYPPQRPRRPVVRPRRVTKRDVAYVAVLMALLRFLAFLWRQLTEVGEVNDVPASRVNVEWKVNYWVVGLWFVLGGVIVLLVQ